jgi:hypothetical protein
MPESKCQTAGAAQPDTAEICGLMPRHSPLKLFPALVNDIKLVLLIKVMAVVFVSHLLYPLV